MQSFKDIHLGKSAFLFGNADSLKLRDLGVFEGKLTFGSNLIYKSVLRPAYYAIEDALVIEDRYKEILEADIRRGFFPSRFWHFHEAGNFKPVESVWLRYDGDLPAWLSNDVFSLGFTVTYFLLQLAFYMGIRTVYLLGVKHSYKLPPHIKDGETLISTGEDSDHFTEDYFKPGARFHDPNLPRMEQAYRRAKIEFEKAGGKIYNCTLGTKLKVFPIKKLEGVINDPLASP